MIWAIVVPSNRPEKLEQFRKSWAPYLEKYSCEVIEVLDTPEGWKEIPEFIPRRTDMIRSWGFYLARKAQFIVSLDDDVEPHDDLLGNYREAFRTTWPFTDYFSVGSLTDFPDEMRGFPYIGRSANVGVQAGGWIGSLDLDGPTQLRFGGIEGVFLSNRVPVPRGCATTVCAMNMAFNSELAPIMWQLPMLDGRYNRFGDIWAGLFAKKVLDRIGQVLLINGKARVRHERASDPYVNLVKEGPGMKPNEGLWAALPEPESSAVTEAYREVTDGAARYFAGFDPEYAGHFVRCRDEWLSLFER